MELRQLRNWIGVLMLANMVLVNPLQAGEPGLSTNRLSPWFAGLPQDDKRWTLELGLEAGLEPDYVGSDDSDVEVFPIVRLLYNLNDQWRLRLTPQTLGLVRDINDKLLLQLVIEREQGREASETQDLKALEDGADTTEAELTLAYRFGSQRRSFVYATYQPEIQDRDKGVVAFLGIGRQFNLGEKLKVTGVVDVSWGDSEHMFTEFGVSSLDAAALGVTGYQPGGGVKSSTAGFTMEWQLKPRLALLASAEVEHYFSKAADSPLLDELGAKNTYELELSLVYQF